MVRRARAAAEVDPAACPICGGANRCVRADGGDGPCWCRDETFSFSLLARAGTGKACICERCLREHARTGDDGFAEAPVPPGARR